jgi:hypothetical protein
MLGFWKDCFIYSDLLKVLLPRGLAGAWAWDEGPSSLVVVHVTAVPVQNVGTFSLGF